MRAPSLHGLLLALLFAFPVRSADSSAQRDSILFVSGELLTHIYNTEFDNAFREGESFFGSYAKGRVTFVPFKRTQFSLGLHVRKSFGDELFVSDIRPLFRARYTMRAFSLVLGELVYTSRRHGLPDALLREDFMYDPAVEEGLQVLFEKGVVRQDAWMSYSALNTQKHREHISAGNMTCVTVGPVAFSLMGYADHYGGQLFAPVGDPVRDNVTGAGGISFAYGFEGPLQELGDEQLFVGSYTTEDRSAGVPRRKGWGSLTRAWVKVLGFLCRLGYFQGHDYVTWEGDALYRTNKPYYFVHMSRIVSFPGNVSLDFGARIEFVGIGPSEWGKRGEHVAWVQLGWCPRKLLR